LRGKGSSPRYTIINRYVSAYMAGLNQHIPMIHIPSLNLNEIPMEMLLVLCGIGALYCFEKDHAMELHSIAVTLLHKVVTSLLGRREADLDTGGCCRNVVDDASDYFALSVVCGVEW